MRGRKGAQAPRLSSPRAVLSGEQSAAKLRKLREIVGLITETELFAAAMSDSVCPAICCNPDNPQCNYTAEMEPDEIAAGAADSLSDGSFRRYAAGVAPQRYGHDELTRWDREGVEGHNRS
jgi:hypothetical protein